ncbi:phosphorylase [Plectonema cf. radiosum LEGE 06105]|uniref:Phosphorylase n=1 Tax=Plectonema cf. radiosum LEGE 06105 TaxID=945769 RepID=A0A8J7K3Y1_9CYAN|nr:phosphorylase [Plectonema radiosum]MBE9215722.1 phosphorylase [Plectonema cf. radiosum LEGE 06105]
MLKPGILWTRVKEQTQHGLECGALQSIATDYEFVEENGVHFLVRILSNLKRKDEAKNQQDKASKKGQNFNPFLPYEEDLFVGDISETHLCLLNKYNVVDNHLLIVTREFEEQDNLLNYQDFQAMWICLAEIDGLLFYNAGKIAGASQRHKHLQLVPTPLAPTQTESVPIASLFASAVFDGDVGKIPDLPFIHGFYRFDSNLINSVNQAAQITLEVYYKLLKAVDLIVEDTQNQTLKAYNFLATREWMLIVPRSQEEFESISINSLGFAGALLVRNQQQMQILKDCNPMTILKQVGVSND